MNSMRRAVIGVDVGGTNLRFALAVENGEICARFRAKTDGTRDGFLNQLKEGIAEIRGLASEVDSLPVGIGIGVPGLIARDGMILSSVNLPQCEGMNPAIELSRALRIPVTVGNDANAAACGEHRFGAGRSFASMLMITLGTGVGGGLILDNRLWIGSDGFAGEFGHFTVEPEGKPCLCGNRGCVEQYASAEAITRAARLIYPDYIDLSSESVAAAAASGDSKAMELFMQAGRYLGIAAASVINLLNLDAVVIGGGVAGSFPLWRESMYREITERAFGPSAERVKIVKGELGDDAGVLGAAALAFADQGDLYQVGLEK